MELIEKSSVNSAGGKVKKYKILIAEDNKLNLKLIETLLEKNNYSVISAINGEDAIQAYFSESPDLIIMDVEMPVLNGYETVKRIRESERNNDYRIPVIALTGHFFKEDIERIFECGMDDYVPKPVNFDIFLAKIKNYLTVKNNIS
ncbi:MAG: response regulator [Ignavibacteriae bacterium]|nr:response regulator [Ignavibacteriota bacterium]